MDFLFFFEKNKVKDLNNVLSADSFAQNSFARVGFVQKDGKSLEEKDGFFVYFKTEESIGNVLSKKLIDVQGVEVKGEEKKRIIKKINEQENQAIEGFGSIFQ